MRRSRLPLAALIAISSLAAACAPSPAIISPPTGSPITVGAVLSLTGSQATNGQMAKEGYLYCQHWINSKGGINLKAVSHQLSLDIADDQSRPSIAASTTEHLISENHDSLLLGPSSDATASRAGPHWPRLGQRSVAGDLNSSRVRLHGTRRPPEELEVGQDAGASASPATQVP